MTEILFYVLVAGLVFSNLTLVISIASPKQRFWPPPDPPSWRYTMTRYTGLLGPFSVVGLLALGVLDRGSFGWGHEARFVVGVLLFAPGSFLALWGAFGLGLEASMGKERDLVAKGAYRVSRNPQYVGSVVGLLGYALLCNSTLTLVVWALWTLWFGLAPFAEEPWLREKLGAPYDAYVARVRRYL